MTKGDKEIQDLLIEIIDGGELHVILERNRVLVEYTGKELDNYRDVPSWQYLMLTAEKLYEEYEEEFENGTYDWNIFDYGPDRFIVWAELEHFIQDMKENAEIEAAYEKKD